MERLHDQTVSEICRLAKDQTDESAAEIAQCFADLTQLEAFYVAARVSVELGRDHCDLLAESISGKAGWQLEPQAMGIAKIYDRGGVDEAIRELSQRDVIAGITLIPMLHYLRGGVGSIATRLVSLSNDQITEIC